MLSQTAQYALRAVVFLANQERSPVTRTVIAEGTMVPADYLLKVLKGLELAHIVESRRGPGGGYILAIPADELSVYEVVVSVDEIPRITTCPLGIKNHKRLCPLHQLLDDASRTIEESFKKTMIADLVVRGKHGCDFPALES
ncbi:MAG: Rrf2 family transcriptional regulator [Pirellulaceae bacterium]